MLKELSGPDLSLFYNDKVEQSKYQQMVQSTLKRNDFHKKILRSFNQRAGRRLNGRFRELHNHTNINNHNNTNNTNNHNNNNNNYASTSNYDADILRILGLSNISEVSKITIQEWDSVKRKYREQLKNSLLSSQMALDNWGSIADSRLILIKLLKGGKSKKWINGASLADLLQFIQQEFDELLQKQMVEFYKVQYLPEINKFMVKLQKDLKTQIPQYLKIPEFHSSSIPLGIDDGQVYQLQEEYTKATKDIKDIKAPKGTLPRLTSVTMKISIRAGTTQMAKLDGIQSIARYNSMLDKGFSAQRGVLSFSRGKYYIFLPFKKRVSEKRDGDLIASADLGLKTFATLSVFNINKNKEIDRKFMDQQYLGGKKELWFGGKKLVNLKSKLMQHRYVARKYQSVRMKSKRRTVKHWFARNVEKGKWNKIGNTHTELVHQLASRIIAYLNHHQVSTLVLENLKWSKHGSKNKVGYFLSTWQIHWFFSQVQKQLMNMALLHGIHVELVNPKNSSKTCWKCGEFGKRSGKQFVCTGKSCVKYQLDSDLNAARNLVLRSKRYIRLRRRF